MNMRHLFENTRYKGVISKWAGQEGQQNGVRKMVQGLTSTQEIVEVRLDSFMRGSIADALAQELAARPAHRIVALSAVAGGDEFNGVIRVVAVIEYL